MYLWVSASKLRYMRRLEEGAGSPGATVTGSCEQPSVEAGKETQVLSKSQRFS